MLDCEEYRELSNAKWYNTSTERTMSENGSIEENPAENLSENVEEVSGIQTLTQKVVNEQIEGNIAPLKRQLEELTRMVQGMVTTPHPCHCPKTDFGKTSGTAAYESDFVACS